MSERYRPCRGGIAVRAFPAMPGSGVPTMAVESDLAYRYGRHDPAARSLFAANYVLTDASPTDIR